VMLGSYFFMYKIIEHWAGRKPLNRSRRKNGLPWNRVIKVCVSILDIHFTSWMPACRTETEKPNSAVRCSSRSLQKWRPSLGNFPGRVRSQNGSKFFRTYVEIVWGSYPFTEDGLLSVTMRKNERDLSQRHKTAVLINGIHVSSWLNSRWLFIEPRFITLNLWLDSHSLSV
jgi:hypothetical protein